MSGRWPCSLVAWLCSAVVSWVLDRTVPVAVLLSVSVSFEISDIGFLSDVFFSTSPQRPKVSSVCLSVRSGFGLFRRLHLRLQHLDRSITVVISSSRLLSNFYCATEYSDEILQLSTSIQLLPRNRLQRGALIILDTFPSDIFLAFISMRPIIHPLLSSPELFQHSPSYFSPAFTNINMRRNSNHHHHYHSLQIHISEMKKINENAFALIEIE